jgi:hypothetical protein
VLTLLCLYALFHGAIAARRRTTQSNALAPLPRSAA